MSFFNWFKKKTEPVKVGDKAPDFTLPALSGEPVRLSDFRGRTVVLYFYPKDNTYGCIAESCLFRDRFPTFRELDAEIVGISSDPPESHRQFAAKYKLPFVLLSDVKNEVRRLYGVPPSLGIIPGRTTYVIDPEGVVRQVFSSQIQIDSHVALSLEKVQELRSAGRNTPAG